MSKILFSSRAAFSCNALNAKQQISEQQPRNLWICEQDKSPNLLTRYSCYLHSKKNYSCFHHSALTTLKKKFLCPANQKFAPEAAI
jgi:hypothetical protein